MNEQSQPYDVGPSMDILRMHRPHGAEQWMAWHAQRDNARTVLDHVVVIGPDGTRDWPDTMVTRELLIQALGLDLDSEAELLTRWT